MAMRLKSTEEITESGVVYIVETYESDKTERTSVVKKLKPTYIEPEEPVETDPTQLDRIESVVNDIAKNSVSWDTMAQAISEGVNEV